MRVLQCRIQLSHGDNAVAGTENGWDSVSRLVGGIERYVCSGNHVYGGLAVGSVRKWMFVEGLAEARYMPITGNDRGHIAPEEGHG